MSNKKVIEALNTLLADTYALYLKTQNYHWNVTGPNFQSLHLLFESEYTDLANAVDEIAERIRALGAKAPATFADYNKIKNVTDGDANAKAEQMTKQLADDQAVLLNTLKQVLEAAQAVNDEGTVALVSNRIETHEKAQWMLRSSL